VKCVGLLVDNSGTKKDSRPRNWGGDKRRVKTGGGKKKEAELKKKSLPTQELAHGKETSTTDTMNIARLQRIIEQRKQGDADVFFA